MPAHYPSIEDVEGEIVSGARRLGFSRPVEILYREETAGERIRLFVVCSLVAVCLYDAFLVNDWLMLKDVFGPMLMARLGVFTPAIVICMLVVSRGGAPLLRETLGVMAGALAVVLPMGVMLLSQSPYRLNYQFGTLLIMVFVTVIQRLPFRFAILCIACILAIQLVTTGISDAMDSATFAANAVFFASAAALLLLASYFLERSDRLSYLFSLRARILHAKLEQLARIDPLTLLFNRRHLGDVLTGIWETARGTPVPVSLVLLDVDNFKAFNDTYGHLRGDACLKQVSDCIARVTALAGGQAFRFGGEEILVLLPGRCAEEACTIAEALRAAIEAEAVGHPVLGAGKVVTASLGVSSAMVPGVTADRLLAEADAALYAAKRAGRNRVSRARVGEPAAASDDAPPPIVPIRKVPQPRHESNPA